MRRKNIASVALTAWLLGIVSFMAIFQTVDIETYFMLALFGLIVLLEFSGSIFSRPRFTGYLWFLTGLQVLVFSAFIARKIAKILIATQ
jgi:hypothetical protein